MTDSIYQIDRPPQRVKAGIQVRVRGMSSRHKFFDVTVETCYVGKTSLITRLQSFVDLETEIHVLNLRNNLGGTFRVIWMNAEAKEGWHDIGLEVIEAEGNMWGIDLPSGHAAADAPPPHVWLQCQRCRTGQLTSLPEAEDEFVRDGFVISRPCERCKATTPWGFTPVDKQEAPGIEPSQEMRNSGRAPLAMKIKVLRQAFGMPVEDICETINVSRDGACFHSRSGYSVGERLRVIMPYKEGDVAIPVPARVVRLNPAKEGPFLAVAIHLEAERN